jgi:hypothetical protein
MATELFTLKFSGLDAEEGRLDLYDASISNHDFARTLAILGHFYQTGEIISQAPRSDVRIYIYASAEGSFKQMVGAAVLSAVIAAPFTIYIQRIIDDWVPHPNAQTQQIIELLQEKNKILRDKQGLPPEPTPEEAKANAAMSELLEKRGTELQVLRSITANSFKDVFRPGGLSAKYVAITSGKTEEPIAAIDPIAALEIEAEKMEPEVRKISGVVNYFSRSSKSVIIFSKELNRGIQFEEIIKGQLRPQDNYSWSQYTRGPIELTGQFVYWFDGRIKKFLVRESVRLPAA